MALTNAFVERPGCILLLALTVCIIMCIISAACGFLNLDDMSDREFLIWKDKPTTNLDMVELAKEWSEKNSVELVDENYDVVIPERSDTGESFYILYENKNEGSQYGLLDREILI